MSEAGDNKLSLFEGSQIRTVWDAKKEEWYFSVVDVCGALSGSNNPRRYWSDLKRKLSKEGAVQLYDEIVQLKMRSPDGKAYATDASDSRGILRIIQSIPSPKAEPFKRWLAQVGAERIDETVDPELAIDRALETYLAKGYDPAWVNQRVAAIRVRKELTDEWRERGVDESRDFAILTDEITRAWSGMSTREYKDLKGLKKESLRDNMSTLELVLNMLGEATTTEISKQKRPKGLGQNRAVAREGGAVAGNARRDVEERTGVPVITEKRARDLNAAADEVIRIEQSDDADAQDGDDDE